MQSLETPRRYQLDRRLAVGGMAEVWRARMLGIEGFERRVVVKRMLPHLAADAEYCRMFLQEARLGAMLHHQNITQVIDIGRHPDIGYFIAMEYLDGADLRAILTTTGRALPIEHALWIALGTCAGLDYAHERSSETGGPLRIVHRDISPANIFVTRDGGVKLLDFGIAKMASHAAQTQPGAVRGKLAYMSPEQARGERLDRRTDLFSVGVILYEMTTGQPPFAGANEAVVLSELLDGPIRAPSQLVPDYDPALEAIVMTALDRDPERRYQSAAELGQTLARYAADRRLTPSAAAIASHLAAAMPLPDTARPGKRSHEATTKAIASTAKLRRRVVVAAIAGIAAIGTTIWLVGAEPAAPTATTASDRAPPAEPASQPHVQAVRPAVARIPDPPPAPPAPPAVRAAPPRKKPPVPPAAKPDKRWTAGPVLDLEIGQ